MKYRLLFIILVFILCYISFICSNLFYAYYTPAKEREVYRTIPHNDDTLRIAFIGDSWAFGHQRHQCTIKETIENTIHRPVSVSSYGIGGLTSKEIYNALFEINTFRVFIEHGYDYCYISAGINDANKKMSKLYYKQSMNCIIRFMLKNRIHPIIQEIPDYNIISTFEKQQIRTKAIRYLSMIINNSPINCKTIFREAINELIIEEGYQNKVSIIHYNSWNKNYEKDLNELYINDQVHLNDKGYLVLDSVISTIIINHINNS